MTPGTAKPIDEMTPAEAAIALKYARIEWRTENSGRKGFEVFERMSKLERRLGSLGNEDVDVYYIVPDETVSPKTYWLMRIGDDYMPGDNISVSPLRLIPDAWPAPTPIGEAS